MDGYEWMSEGGRGDVCMHVCVYACMCVRVGVGRNRCRVRDH